MDLNQFIEFVKGKCRVLLQVAFVAGIVTVDGFLCSKNVSISESCITTLLVVFGLERGRCPSLRNRHANGEDAHLGTGSLGETTNQLVY